MSEQNWAEKFPKGTNVVVDKDAALSYGVRANQVGVVKAIAKDGKLKIKFKKKKKSIEIDGNELIRVDEIENPGREACDNCGALQKEKQALLDKIEALKASLVCTNCDVKEAEGDDLQKQLDAIKSAQQDVIDSCKVHPKLQEETKQLKQQVETLETQLKEREDFRKSLQTKIKLISYENEDLKVQISDASIARDLKLQNMRGQYRKNAKNFKSQKKDLILEAQKLENQKEQLQVELTQMNVELNDKKQIVKETIIKLMQEMAKYPEDHVNRPLSEEARQLRQKINEIKERAKDLDIVQINMKFN